MEILNEWSRCLQWSLLLPGNTDTCVEEEEPVDGRADDTEYHVEDCCPGELSGRTLTDCVSEK